jgi:hypothetical protein
VSILRPSYALTLGGQRWTEQVTVLEVRLAAAPLPGLLSARLPAGGPVSAAPGDAASLDLDGGEGGATVFTGTVDTLRRDPEGVTVTALDAAGTLAAYRPAATYEKVTAGTVIGQLCGDVGVAAGAIDNGVDLAFYVADPGRSALEHVARLAGWGGALARVNGNGALDAQVVNAAQPELALRYGRELLAFERARAAAPVQAFVVAGEAGAGSTSDPKALRPVADFFAGSRPAGPSATDRWRFEPALRTAASARTAGAALERAYRSGRGRGRLEALLLPALRPGTVLEVQDLPDGLEGGPVWLDRVWHHLSAAGASTRARLWQGGDGFDSAGLLGSLAGAL